VRSLPGRSLRTLGGIAVVLAAILAWELLSPPNDLPVSAAARADPVQVRQVAEPDLDILSDVAKTLLARPLFSPDRRPAPPIAAVVAAGAGDDVPRLAAVIVGPAGGRAIFDDGSGHPRIAAEGDSVGHFKVGAIAPGQVSLTASEGERVLRPRYATSAGASGPPAAGAAGSRR
jgi:hypothetical protein